MQRMNYSSGAPLENKTGYSRMVKIGSYIRIGGTTSVQADGSVYGAGNLYEQAKYIYKKFVNLLERAGASASDVFAVRCFVVDMDRSSENSKAFSEIFGMYRPTMTVVGTQALKRPEQLIEIELEAMLDTRV